MEEERQGLTNADATDNRIAESITATDNEDVVPISHTTSGGESDGEPDEDLEAGQTFELDKTALPPPQQQVKKSSQEVGKKTKNQTTLVNMLKERMDGQKKLFECVEKLMTPQVPPIPEDEVDLFFKSMVGTVKKFTPQQIAQVKAQVFNIVNKIELSNLSFCDQSFTQTPHTSRPTSAYSSHTSTTWGEESDDSWLTQL
ncbi:hypothetical protein J6590_074927 [Homalodisca vitripennis]|nr:hypothetical protein J6590_074927 [Homalodisca vitripennis]